MKRVMATKKELGINEKEKTKGIPLRELLKNKSKKGESRYLSLILSLSKIFKELSNKEGNLKEREQKT